MIVGITGSIGAGKSTLLMSLAAALKGRGLSVGGILSIRQSRNGQRSGYELLNLTDGSVMPLATLEQPAPEQARDYLQLCSFYFYKSGLEAGNEAIFRALSADCLFIDEIGFWELSGGGWARHLHLLPQRKKPVFLGLRIGVAQDLRFRYGVELTRHIRLEIHDMDTVLEMLIKEVVEQRKKVSGGGT